MFGVSVHSANTTVCFFFFFFTLSEFCRAFCGKMINLTQEMHRVLGKAWRAGLPPWQHNGLRHWPLTGPCHRTRGRGSASADNTHNTHYAPPPPSPSGDTTASHWICHFCLFIPAPGGIVLLEIKTSDIRDTSRSPRVSEVFLLFIQRSSLRSADCVFSAEPLLK